MLSTDEDWLNMAFEHSANRRQAVLHGGELDQSKENIIVQIIVIIIIIVIFLFRIAGAELHDKGFIVIIIFAVLIVVAVSKAIISCVVLVI